jgi:hypothetical protein
MRAPSVGSYKSRTTALAHITPAPMAVPWAMRQMISISMLGAMALQIEANT